MTELTFELKKDQPFVELNKILQILKIAQTGGHAKILIQNEQVLVNGKVETRVRKKMTVGETIEVEGRKVTVI